MDYSAYQRSSDGVWIGTHRLPLESAIFVCKQIRRQTYDGLVAIVPDNKDPAPYLALVEKLA